MVKAHAVTSKLWHKSGNLQTIMAQTLPLISESKQEKIDNDNTAALL